MSGFHFKYVTFLKVAVRPFSGKNKNHEPCMFLGFCSGVADIIVL